jgi:hypothetical protein
LDDRPNFWFNAYTKMLSMYKMNAGARTAGFPARKLSTQLGDAI